MAKRRSKREDLVGYPVTPERQLEHPSGWCMTLTHEFCPHQFNHGKCGCDCHKTRATVAKKRGRPTKASVEIIEEIDKVGDPRPWKKA